MNARAHAAGVRHDESTETFRDTVDTVTRDPAPSNEEPRQPYFFERLQAAGFRESTGGEQWPTRVLLHGTRAARIQQAAYGLGGVLRVLHTSQIVAECVSEGAAHKHLGGRVNEQLMFAARALTDLIETEMNDLHDFSLNQGGAL